MALNAVLSALLKDFVQSQQLLGLSEGEQFEHFSNYSIVSDIYGNEFNPVDVSTGAQEVGLDGIAVIVNGNLVDDTDEVDDLAKKNKYLEVDFVFTQSKTAAAFDGGDISKTLLAVEDFFGVFKLLQGDKVRSRYALKQHIYKNAAHFRRRSPKLSIYYVSAGSWKSDTNLMTIINASVERLTSTGLFSDVVFNPVDGQSIQNLYFRTKNAVRRQVNFSKNVSLPAIKGVQESYIGLLPVSEYLKLIEDDNKSIRKQLFFDNMRDFIADSETNKEIAGTLSSKRDTEFPLRNNGVTIVARKLTRVSDIFDLEDFQIVNGCQTSHVIFNTRKEISADVVVPVKIIVTEDDDVITKIIRGSNFSNQFDKSQLWATEPFHKDLEIFFQSNFDGENKLFYERRKGQFGSDDSIEKIRVVTPQALLKSFASTFLERPHDVTKYYSALEPEVGKTIFAEGQNPYIYYAAALAAFRLESFFRGKKIPNEYKPVRNHLLYGMKAATLTSTVDMRDKNADKKIASFLDTLLDASKSLHVVQKLIALVDKAKRDGRIDTFSQLAKSVVLRDVMRRQAADAIKRHRSAARRK